MPHYFTHSVVNENYLSLNINCQFRTSSLAILKISPFTLAHLLLISFSLLWCIFVLSLIIMARCMNIIYSNNFFIMPSFFLLSSWNANTPMLTHWIFFWRTLHSSSFSIFFYSPYSKDLIISIYHVYWFFYPSSLPLNS